jgi:hypothetical protein
MFHSAAEPFVQRRSSSLFPFKSSLSFLFAPCRSAGYTGRSRSTLLGGSLLQGTRSCQFRLLAGHSPGPLWLALTRTASRHSRPLWLSGHYLLPLTACGHSWAGKAEATKRSRSLRSLSHFSRSLPAASLARSALDQLRSRGCSSSSWKGIFKLNASRSGSSRPFFPLCLYVCRYVRTQADRQTYIHSEPPCAVVINYTCKCTVHKIDKMLVTTTRRGEGGGQRGRGIETKRILSATAHCVLPSASGALRRTGKCDHSGK